MWEFPSHILPDSNNSTAGARKKLAREFVTGLFNLKDTSVQPADTQSLDLEHVGELGSVPWVFSHLKLTMHVHLFRLHSHQDIPLVEGTCPRRWAGAEAVEAETMGTGMRQCWKSVAEAVS